MASAVGNYVREGLIDELHREARNAQDFAPHISELMQEAMSTLKELDDRLAVRDAPDNVVHLHAVTNEPIDPQRVLDGARGLCPVLVIGRDPEEGELVMASSTPDAWQLEYMLHFARTLLRSVATPNWQEPGDG